MLRIVLLVILLVLAYVWLVERKRGTPHINYDLKFEDTRKTPREKRTTANIKVTPKGQIKSVGKTTVKGKVYSPQAIVKAQKRGKTVRSQAKKAGR